MALDITTEQEGGKLKAVASGTLPSGQPVVVNSDGTVSVISSSSTSESAGSDTVFTSGITPNYIAAVYVPNVDRLMVIANEYVYIGDISGSSITFQSPTTFESTARWVNAAYDPTSGQVLMLWHNGSAEFQAMLATVPATGNTISYGSNLRVDVDKLEESAIAYDTVNEKFVVVYTDWTNLNRYGTALVGTVSGTSISFGTPVVFRSARTDASFACVYDVSSGKTVIAYEEVAGSNNITAIVGTISGTSISFGSAVTVSTAGSYTTGLYDSASQKTVIFYKNSTGRARVGTVSGTSISFGTEAVFGTNPAYIKTVYDTTAQKIVVSYNENFATTEMQSAKVSGTDITFDSPREVSNSVYTEALSSAYDPDTGKVILAYKDNGNSNNGTYVVYKAGYISTNLTSGNYIGMSGGVVDVTNNTQQVGTPVEYTTTNGYGASVYDPNSNKVVFAYNDSANSHHGTVVVGTVSGNSITFGSPVVFNAGSTNQIAATFDSNLNKVVLAYRDSGNSSYGTAIVGTVSGTSISFGSSVVFETANTVYIGASFDTTSNKVVLAYRDIGNSSYGTAIVGTVNGTSISFGTPVVYESATANDNKCVYDSSVNRTVISYRDSANSDYGTAVVGTVNGTAIAFGSPVIFKSASVGYPQMIFDSTANKVVLAYKADGHGKSIVGTTSVGPNSISFGSEATFIASNVEAIGLTFDSNANKHVVSYRNSGVDTEGYLNVGTVSGNIITFGGQVQFENVAVADTYAVFDGTSKKVIITYLDSGGSNVSNAVVFQNASTDITRGQVASGGSATVDIVGTVSTNQLSLTAGQQYYVQIDGTIGETPADPSVLAGTALSATKMTVKS